MLPRLTALLALALGLLRIAALSLHPDKLIADAPFSLADEVEYDARSIDLRSAAENFERTHDRRPTDAELGALLPATMGRLSELALTVRGPCPARCQGRGTCERRTSTCVSGRRRRGGEELEV